MVRLVKQLEGRIAYGDGVLEGFEPEELGVGFLHPHARPAQLLNVQDQVPQL
jgi:hypothetical protein